MDYNKTFFKEIFAVNTNLETWVKNNIDGILNDPMFVVIKPYFEDWLIDYSRVTEGIVLLCVEYKLPIIGLFKIIASFNQRMFWGRDNTNETPGQVLHWSKVSYSVGFEEVTVPFSNVPDIKLLIYPLIIEDLEATFGKSDPIKSLETVTSQKQSSDIGNKPPEWMRK